MKHLKKLTLLLAVISLLFSVSCSKDDGDEDINIDLKNVTFPFTSAKQPINQTIINNLNNSGDQNGLLISSQLSTVNFMTIWLSLFEHPTGATETNTPISACGGSALVYTFTASDDGQSFTMAYQICETTDKYIFQIFVSVNGNAMEEFIYAEESKADLLEGYMEIYAGSFGEVEEDSNSDVYLKYTWKEAADGSIVYTAADSENQFLLTIDMEEDHSGSLSLKEDGLLTYEATWNATGTAGTYAYYDSEGNVTDSGNWPSN
ncbi:hypothetical protein [Ekhidna sp.]|uniref:hypothetical protein n=1 Tax=Ekhidna sp. TaxID=2608089 RepID=UPI0032ECC07D